MQHRALDSRGFSLIEMAIVVLVFGMVVAMAVTGFRSLSADHQLQDSARSVAGQITLARACAMSTGTTQTVNFDASTTPHRVVTLGGGAARTWSLPRDVHYATGSVGTVDMTGDGRASASSYIVLQNYKGLRDTISIESSGLVLAR